MARAKGTPKTGGRKKGTPNKTSGELRDRILASLDRRGGDAYLDGLEDEHYVKLLMRTLPKDLNLSGDVGITLTIERSYVKKP